MNFIWKRKGKKMKRIWFVLLLIIGVCGSLFLKVGYESIIEDGLKTETKRMSGIETDEHYLQYQDAMNNGEIDENGLAKSDLLTDFDAEDLQFEYVVSKGSVEASFTSTNIVDVKYYLDKELTQRLRTMCDIEPNTTVYASVSELKKNYFETHEFVGLELKIDGKRIEEIRWQNAGEIISFNIPNNISTLVVTPKTELKKVNIDFDDYFVDESSTKQKIFGTWEVNGVKYSRDNPLKEAKSGKYTFNYYFDQNEYYINLSINENVYKAENGKVIFTSRNIYSDETETIQLSKYITIKLNNEYKKGIALVQVNNEEVEYKDGSLLKIKCGDRIQITTNKDYTITTQKLTIESTEPLSDGSTKYTFIVPAESNILNYELGISKGKNTKDFVQKTVENGVIEVRYAESNGKAEIGDEKISDKEKVTVKIIPNYGYYITGKDVKNNVYEKTMEYKKYVEDIDDIIKNHNIEKYISVTLSSKDNYGTVKYKIDGDEVSDIVNELKEGQTIEMIYQLSDDNYQIKKDNPLSSTTKKTVKIKVTSEMSGKSISRDQYIEVIKKGD